MSIFGIVGGAVVGYWASTGVIRGGMQFLQGAGLAAACIAEGDPQAALACVAGGLAAPVVGVMEEVKNTVGMAVVTAQVIGGRMSLLGHEDNAQLPSTTKPSLRACQ
jgi:hypothetical protein